MDLSDYISQVCACDDVDALKHILKRATTEMGAAAIFGHALPFGGARALEKWDPIVTTFPEVIGQLYRDHAAHGDPIMDAALAQGAPVHFSKIAKSLTWSDSQRALFRAMPDAGLWDAVSTPVFAKPGVYAYFTAAFDRLRPDLTDADLRRFKVVFSEFYYRHRVLTRDSRVTLSAREREVLVAIVNNKSNAEIAAAMGVSPHTVETYIKRCFTKINVKTRTEAVLKCFGAGLDAPGRLA